MEIKNLVFFKSDGNQIPTQFLNTVTFTVIGNMSSRQGRGYGWRTDASGYVSVGERNQILSFNVTDGGSTYGFEEDVDYSDAVRDLVDEIVIKVDKEGFKSEHSFLKSKDLNEIFDIKIGRREVSYRSDADDNFIYEFFIESVSLKEGVDSDTFLNRLFFNDSEPVSFYPSQQFMNQLMMEKVSTELASTSTIFILEKRKNSKGETGFFRPRSATQNLRFEFASDSDTRIVKTAEEFDKQDNVFGTTNKDEYDYSKVYWSRYMVFDLINEYDDTEDSNEPLVLTLGFIASQEGCYQDILTLMSVDNIKDRERSLAFNRIGYTVVKNESVGEDERYRTLFANFGIPDPKTYPNLFKDIEIYEEGIDWKYLNKKSKELFLSYPQIFPYLGTYKALINAVSFLGYNDVYFKEWYKFFDGKTEGSVSYQSMDISSKTTLQSKLSRIGVSLEDFLDWKKLSQLSMVYLINQEDQGFEVIQNNLGQKKTYQIPTTKPVYSYMNTEVIVKLYALKEWLENYILNINCQIIDVTGEGVYFERYKSQSYVSPVLTNFLVEKETQLTPNFGSNSNVNLPLEMGRAVIECGLGELQESRKFVDLKEMTVMDSIKKKIVTGESEEESGEDVEGISEERLELLTNWVCESDKFTVPEITTLSKQMLVGANAVNLTPFEGTQYEVSSDSECGAISHGVGYFEETKDMQGNPIKVLKQNPLVVMDGEIFIYGHKRKEIEFTVPPVIRMTAGKIRKTFGQWRKNILFVAQGFFDTKSTRTRFCLQNAKKTSQEISDDYVTLYPSKDAHLKFTSNNKYGVPLFIFEGYDTFGGFLSKETELKKFVLEIDEGFIDFIESCEGDNTCIARLKFEQDYNRNNANEQKINVEYIYRTPRKSLMTSEGESIKDEIADNVNTFKESEYQRLDLVKEIQELEYQTSVYDEESEIPLLADSELRHIKEDDKNVRDMLAEKIKDLESLINDRQSLIGNNGGMYDNLYNYQLSELVDKKREYEDVLKDWQEEVLLRFEELREKWLTVLKFERRNNVMYLVSENQESNNLNTKKKYVSEIVLNHIGNYSLTSKATDSYNIPFAAKSNKNLDVDMTPPTVFVNIYDENGDVHVEECDKRPWFVPEYFRYIKNVDKSDNSLLYEDYSYFNDTPKKGDIIHLTNTTEKVDDIDTDFNAEDFHENGFVYDKSKGYIKIVLNDENPCHQNLYYIGAEMYLVYIDKNSCDIVDKIVGEEESRFTGPYTVEFFHNPYIIKNGVNNSFVDDEREENDNYVILSYDSTDLNFVYATDSRIDLMRTGDIVCYAIPKTRIDIELDGISNNENDRTCKIKFRDKNMNGDSLAFSVGQTVKISYSSLTYLGESAGNNGELVDRVSETYISGTTYKILDAYYDYSDFCQTYVLDGLLNEDLVKMNIYKNGVYNKYSDDASMNILGVPYKIRCTISPAHWLYVKYDVMASEDADENNLEGYLKFKDDWFGSDYIDNTFAFTTRKFRTEDAFDDWKTDFDINSTLSAHTEPVVVYRTKNENDGTYNKVDVMLNSFDLAHSMEDGEYMSIWDVYYNPGKDKSEEYLLYQIVNDQPTLALSRDGEYRFQLTSIDKRGNRTVNTKQGFLKIINPYV